MKKLLLLLALPYIVIFSLSMAFSQLANASAGGGQKNKPVSGTVIQEGTCEAVLPPGIDLTKCDLVVASEVSGIATYICPEGIYLCDNSVKEDK